MNLRNYLPLALTTLALVILSSSAFSQAKVQIIHNAPDPAADSVDVYVDGTLLLDNFAFREATAFTDVPADVAISVAVAPKTSASVDDAIATFTLGPLPDGGSYQAIAQGVIDTTAFPANPEGLSTAFTILADTALTVGSAAFPTFVSIRAVHGVPDAPTVSAFVPALGAFLFGGLPYGNLTPYAPGGAVPFLMSIVAGTDTNAVVASFEGDLTGLGDQAVTVLASGWLDDTLGPAMGLIAVTADGTVVTPMLVANEQRGVGIPGTFTLDQNYPNPFNPETTISYNVGVNSHVTVEVFDLLGKRVALLVDETLPQGSYNVNFTADSVPSGNYIYRMTAGDQVQTRMMTLLK